MGLTASSSKTFLAWHGVALVRKLLDLRAICAENAEIIERIEAASRALPGQPAVYPLPAPAGDEVGHFLARIQAASGADALADLAAECMSDLPPHQLRVLYQRLDALPDAARFAPFIEKSPLRVLLSRRPPPVYEATTISSHARLFSASDVPRARKVLLVLFTGINGEVFMPVPRMLLRLPLGGFDVLRLRPAEECDYPHGVPGLGEDFPTVCRAIATLGAGYGGMAAMGGSLGGFAALRAAIVLRMTAGVSLSGGFNAIKWSLGRPSRPAFDPLCACMPRPETLLRAYAARNHAHDVLHGKMLRMMRPSVELIRSSTGTDHNVLAYMVTDGTIDALLQEIRQRVPLPPG